MSPHDLFSRVRLAGGVLGIGGGPLGNHGVAIDDATASATLDRAWDRGVRYLDTAPHYGLGLSERRVGSFLADRPRDEYLLSTKVGRLIRPNPEPRALDDDGFVVPGDLRRVWDFTLDGVRSSLDESRERLGVDPDILLAHDPDQAPGDPVREALAALATLRGEGRVRAIGVGTNSTAGLAELLDAGLIDVVMLANRYSLLDPGAVDTVLEPARRAGAAVVAVGVYATGLLATPRPSPDATFEYGPATPEVRARAVRIAEICEAHGVDLPTAALAFPQRHPAVVGIAVGMRSPAEVDQNADRLATPVPEALWGDLVSADLLPAAAAGLA
ncbi:aldo/keto reductase [Pseudolysinimonas sp.]|uniref:aldo/keto reductase n=1 Tax=Pseudolysinimonas sp. TaxID=2680009 RepID=UPI003F81F2D2